MLRKSYLRRNSRRRPRALHRPETGGDALLYERVSARQQASASGGLRNALRRAAVAGNISKLDADTSAALEVPHAEAFVAVRAAPVKNVDETGWSKKGKLCWLWLAATAQLAVFAIHAQRGKVGFKNLLGKAVAGIVCSDRWGVYARLPFDQRQIYWAHLKRDFQKLKELGGEARKLGNAGLRTVKEIFEAWNEWNQPNDQTCKGN